MITQTIVSAARIAEVLGIQERTVRERAAAGDLVKQGQNKYILEASVQAFLLFTKRAATSKRIPETEGEADLVVERTRLTKAKADMAEMQAETMRGTVHEAGSVESVWTDMILNCRARLLGIPRKMAPRILGMVKPAEIEKDLEVEIHLALNELSNYDPDVILRNYVSAHAEELATAAEAND